MIRQEGHGRDGIAMRFLTHQELFDLPAEAIPEWAEDLRSEAIQDLESTI
jgi:hypothetical protein